MFTLVSIWDVFKITYQWNFLTDWWTQPTSYLLEINHNTASVIFFQWVDFEEVLFSNFLSCWNIFPLLCIWCVSVCGATVGLQVCVSPHRHACAMTTILRGQLLRLGSRSMVGFGNWTQIVRLRSKCLYPLNNLTGPQIYILGYNKLEHTDFLPGQSFACI